MEDRHPGEEGWQRHVLSGLRHSRPSGRKIGWSDLDAFPVEVPRDGRWHTVTVKATVPEFNKDEAWVRPIFGMDQVCDPTPGNIDLRNFELSDR